MMMKTYKSLLAIWLVIYGSQLFAIENYDIRFLLDEVDCQNRTVCYLVQLRSSSNQSWNLAGQNYRIFYDADNAAYISGSLESLLPSAMYSPPLLTQDRQGEDGSGSQGGLSFEDNFSFLNYSIDLMNLSTGGVDLPAQTSGDWLSTSKLCFEVPQSVIDNPSECLEIVWARMGLTDAYATAFVEVSEWSSSNMTPDAIGMGYDDLDPSDGAGSCISAECGATGTNENTNDTCSDNMDNDNDGLIDCADPDCATVTACVGTDKSFDINMVLKSVDCQTGMACYEINLNSATGDNFILGSQDYRLFYDTEVATFSSVVSRLDVSYQPASIMGGTPVENQDATGRGGLAFEGDLGYIDFSINLVSINSGSTVTVAQSTTVTTAEICFTMTTPAIMDENVCFQTAWARSGLTDGYNPAQLRLREWMSDGTQRDLVADDYNDLSSSSGNDACFNTSCGMDERGDVLCSDGIDNDLDGLIDCQDPGCSTAPVCAASCDATAPTLRKQ